MKFQNIFLLIFCFSVACGGLNDDSAQPENLTNIWLPSASQTKSPDLSVKNISLNVESPLVMQVGESIDLIVTVTFADGSTSNDEKIVWYNNNESIATIDEDGRVDAIQHGRSTIIAHYLNYSASLDLVVTAVSGGSIKNLKPTPLVIPHDVASLVVTEEPDDFKSYFLNADDFVTPNYGTNAGYGADPNTVFPQIVWGYPQTGGTHVVSLGGGGTLLIQLNNYIVANGRGVDFTIFENAVESETYGDFPERAQISVSEDGINFTPFPCDAFDPSEVFAGCAGVKEVNAMENPFDPSVSGGDQFDLSDIGVSYAKYILIEDMNTCVSGDISYPRCTTAGTQGFDLDALVILNGVNE